MAGHICVEGLQHLPLLKKMREAFESTVPGAGTTFVFVESVGNYISNKAPLCSRKRDEIAERQRQLTLINEQWYYWQQAYQQSQADLLEIQRSSWVVSTVVTSLGLVEEYNLGSNGEAYEMVEQIFDKSTYILTGKSV